MSTSQTLAIAAHLHVLLRRKTGRVTDTEWMAANLEYAREVIRFARAKALEDGHADLSEWAGKLEQAVIGRTPVQPPLDSGFADSLLEPVKLPTPRDASVPRYVGGIR